jgi:hypothetical protein
MNSRDDIQRERKESKKKLRTVHGVNDGKARRVEIRKRNKRVLTQRRTGKKRKGEGRRKEGKKKENEKGKKIW